MNPETHDVMTYNAETGEVEYRAFTDQERAENEELTNKEIPGP